MKRLALYLLACPRIAAVAQVTVVLPERAQCPACRVSFDKVVTLGRSTDAELIADWPTVQRGPGGQYYVSGASPRSKFLVYGADGALLRAVGRAGGGPNEFRAVVRISSLGGDSIAVIDAGNRRIAVLGGDDRVAHSLVTPFQVVDLAGSRDGVIVSGPARAPDNSMRPVHLLGSDGRILRSFGDPIAASTESTLNMAQRAVAVDDAGGVWMAPFDTYRIERWSRTGQRTMTIRRSPAWFPPRTTTGSRRTWRDPLVSRMRDVWIDSTGLLWVMAVTPKSQWKPSEGNWGGIETDQLNYDTMIEVIDPSTRTLLVTQRFPWVGGQFMDDGSVYTYETNPDGIITIDILRPVFRRR
jgi:hypothetical protein